MKKTLSTIVLASALLLGTVAPVAAHADAVTGTSGTTDTHATFTAPTNKTNPVDPNKPDTDAGGSATDNNGATNNDGPLSFLYVTKNMAFQSVQAVTSATQPDIAVDKISTDTFSSATDAQANPNFVTEISDTRATNAGWSVSVSSSPMTDKDTNVSLKGATVDFNGAGATTIKNSGDAADASGNSAGISANTVSVPTTTATAQTIYNAEKGSGAGSTSFQLDPTNIKLANVGGNTAAGTYDGTLTWALSDTPVDAPATTPAN
ncbi:WxL domain-containing protein [Levilactobacillus mulengensis]|uniref:WxL domain-containing protein n=1 Tax=Levilactobacillus mulengensis TaxID=2486025 RepID=UPI0013DE38ED|nr:WxL domain-containing protein [Levilactobacillus mulengensis]